VAAISDIDPVDFAKTSQPTQRGRRPERSSYRLPGDASDGTCRIAASLRSQAVPIAWASDCRISGYVAHVATPGRLAT
jgi:hypothetical protein